MKNPIEILNEIDGRAVKFGLTVQLDVRDWQRIKITLERQAEELAQKAARIRRVEGAVQSSVSYLASQVPARLDSPSDSSADQSTTALNVEITNDKHDWKCISPGEYDTMYECQRCEETHLESIDNPNSEPPITGCKGK